MSASKISYTDFGGPSQVRAVSLLSSHRHLFRFLFRCDLTASFLQHARKKISFPTIPTRRTLSVTNVTSFVFIFFMSDIRNADTFDRVFRRPAELAFRRNGDTLLRLGVNKERAATDASRAVKEYLATLDDAAFGGPADLPGD
jgi:hypothetical protein